MNQIDRLNDDCLQKIFDYLPITQLLELELVCLRWKCLIKYRNKHQISLKLFRGRDEINEYNRNEHIYYQLKSCPYFQQTNDFMITTHLNYLSCQLILSKYPNLKMLLISGCLWEPQDLLMLLKELKQLECFSLILCGLPFGEAYFAAMVKTIKICMSLDFLPRLKHCAISLAHNTLSNPFNIYFMFKIEELYLHNVTVDYNVYYNDKILDKCKKMLPLNKHAIFNVKRAVDMNEKTCKKLSMSIKQLTIKYENKESFATLFETVCTNFTLLNFLDIHLNFNLELKTLYSSLNKLMNLKEFRLRSDDNSSIVDDETSDDSDEFSVAINSVQSFHLDMDFEPAIFTLLPRIFPLVKHLTVNTSRLCCSCPNMPDTIEKLIVVPNPDQMNVQQAPNNEIVDGLIPVQQQGQQPVPIVENDSKNDDVEYELDNCLKCSKQTIQTLSQWKLLETFSIIGSRCKDEALESLKSLSGLRSLSVSNCEGLSLRSLLNVCYEIAKSRSPNKSFTLKLNDKHFKKIIKLPLKPANFFIFNVSPLLDFET